MMDQLARSNATAAVTKASSRPRRNVGVERVHIRAAYRIQLTTWRAPVTPMRSGARETSGPGGGGGGPDILVDHDPVHQAEPGRLGVVDYGCSYQKNPLTAFAKIAKTIKPALKRR